VWSVARAGERYTPLRGKQKQAVMRRGFKSDNQERQYSPHGCGGLERRRGAVVGSECVGPGL